MKHGGLKLLAAIVLLQACSGQAVWGQIAAGSFAPRLAIPEPPEVVPPPPGTSAAGAQPCFLPSAIASRASGLKVLSCREADQHRERGWRLACCGACYAARSEFVAALQCLADGLDVESSTTEHRAALTAGLTALEEVEELLPSHRSSGLEVNLDRIIRRHHTPVLKGVAEKKSPTCGEAVDCYLKFAQEQLLRAVQGKEASDILRGLARICEILEGGQDRTMRLPELKTAVFCRAALVLNPGDSRIANDLGVLLVRLGDIEQGRSLMEYSLRLSRQPAVLRNLSVVYQQLGDTASAARARQAAEEPGVSHPEDSPAALVQWVDPATFARFGDELQRRPVNCWGSYAQGEYIGAARTVHVPEYRLRVDDQLDFVYRQIRSASSKPYRLMVGDEIRVLSLSKPGQINSDRIVVQPDGMITLPLLGQVLASGCTLTELRDDLEQRYKAIFEAPEIAVVPQKMDTEVQDFLNAVDRRYGAGGGQVRSAVVLPDGSITLPAIGTLRVQGLTVSDLELEVNERYGQSMDEIRVTPVLTQTAPRFAYVTGEVRQPGRFQLLAPTTVSQAVSLAGGWTVGANLRQVVVLRRGEDWRVMGCMVNVNDILYAKKTDPHSDIWLSDSDVVIVPKGNLLKADDFIQLIFTRGIYGVFPMSSILTL